MQVHNDSSKSVVVSRHVCWTLILKRFAMQVHNDSSKSVVVSRHVCWTLILKRFAMQVHNDSSKSVVVYTPCLLDPDAGIRTFNVTLPEGTFCSDTMADPSKTLLTLLSK